MAKITRKQIAEKDVFGDIGKSALSAKEKVVLLEQSIQMLSGVAKNIRGTLKGLTPNNTASINKINAATEKANIIAKERERLQKRLNIANSTAIDRNTELKVLLQEQNKTNKRLAREKLGLISAYQKESKRLIDLRNKYKDLAVQNKENTREGRQLLKQITNLDARLKQIDATVGQHQRNVGNYTAAIGKLRAGFGRLAGALGIAGGFMALRRVMSNSIDVISGFEQSLADIRAVTNASNEEMDAFAEKAREVGASTQFSASEVAGLQFELGKLGFETDFILAATEDISDFAAATGVSLPEAATLAGSALNAFGLDVDDMQRVVSVLGVSTSTTALDFQKLNNSLSTVAPVAASFGFSIEDTVALLGQLSNAGFDASSAATATRNILLNLADANGALAKELGKPIENSEDLAEALIELKDGGIDLAEALELTDKRSVAAFNTFVENADTLVDVRQGITDVNDELQRMADDRLDTLQGDLKLLNSAWQEWLLGVNDSTGGVSRLRQAVQFITRNLDKLLKIIKLVGIAWAAWKLGKLTGTIIESTKGLIKMAGSLRKVKGATDAAKVSQDRLNTSVRSNPYGLLASALATVIALVWDYADANDAATESQEILNNAVQDANDLLEERGGVLNKRLRQINLQMEEELKVAKRVGASEAEIAAVRNKFTTQNQQAISDEIDAIENLITAKEEDIRVNEANLRSVELRRGTGKELFNQEERELTLQRGIANDKARVEVFKDQIEALRIRNQELELGRETPTRPTRPTRPTKPDEPKGDPNTRLKELRKLLKENRLAVELLADENTQASDKRILELNTEGRLLQAQIAHIEKLLSLELEKQKAVEKGDRQNIQLLSAELKARRALADIDEFGRGNIDEAKILRDLEIEQSEIKLKFLNEELVKKEEILMADFNALSTQSKLFEEVQEMRVKALKLEEKIRDARFEETQESLRKEELDLEIEFLDRKLNGRVANAEEIAKAEIKMKRKIAKAEKEIEDELLFGDLSEEERIEAIRKFEKKVANAKSEFNDVAVNRKKETDEEIEEAEKDLNKKLIALQIERLRERRILYDKESEEYKKLTKEIFELQKEAQDLDKTDEEILQQQFEVRRNVITVFTDYFIQQSDRRIQKINEEIQAAERQANVLAGLAASGNITARESLAEQDRIIAEANLRKEQEEKRKQRILLVSSVLEAYNNELAANTPPNQALTRAITSTAVLQQFVAALPTFFDGIEDTGTHGQGVDGKGGFHAILHPNERVMTKEQNKKLKGYSNDEVAQIVEQYRYGNFIKIEQGTKNDLATQELKKELALVRKAINDKPEQIIELGSISQAAMTIRETTKRGNRITTNTFKVN